MAEKSKKSTIEQYRDEFGSWLRELTNYQSRFKVNYRRYTGVNDTKGTQAKVADPVAFELVERVIQKLFEREPKFFAESKGKNIPREVKNVLTGVAEYLWNNQDMVQATGTMRSKLKVLGREFIITGNVATEAYWNPTADAPDMRIIPIEDVIFDPSKTLKTSPVYYVRQFVSLQYLKDNAEIKDNGEVVSGMFKTAAIKKLERTTDDRSKKKDNPSENLINRSGTELQRKEDEFQLISRWEGKKCCRFIWDDDLEEPILVQEFESILADDPLDFAMDIEVVKEPYAISLIDPQAGLFKAKDMILNQTLDYGAKVLNPPTIVNPQGQSVNLKTIANMYKLGGIVVGDPKSIEHKPMPPFPGYGMDMLHFIEQRAESISGIGAYLAGVPNSDNDKTQGTKGGIEALQSASTSPVKDRQTNIEESIIEPVVNKWLKMVGATMSDDDIKWVLVTGEAQKWVRVTKGLLTGKIKLIDLYTAGILDDEQMEDIASNMMMEGKDPEEEVMFDVDWVIRVETGSLAERDTAKDVENKKMILEQGMALQLPLDREKLWKDIALDAGLQEPEQYLIKDQMQPGMMPEEGGMDGQGIPAEGMGQPQQGPNTPQPAPGFPGMAGQGMPVGVGGPQGLA